MAKEASLNDIFGMMGGLMSALGSPKDAAAIKDGMDQLGFVMGALGEGVVKEAVDNSHEIPTTVGKPIYEWVPLENNKAKLPSHALVACKDHGNPVYVARGLLDGSIRLGKFHAKYETLFVSHLGKEAEVYDNIEVFCVDKDAKVKWVDSELGQIPKGGVVGTIVDGKSEFVGRGITDGEISPGRIVPEDKRMYASYGGEDVEVTKYQALVIENGKPLYKWVPVDNWVLPKNAVPVSKDVYIGRASLNQKIRLAKVHNGNKKLYVAHSGKVEEIMHKAFEILCVDPAATVEWKDFENGKVPERAIVGSIVDGRLEFVGRGQTESETSPGQIVPADGCMYAAYKGKCVTLTKYQALVIQ